MATINSPVAVQLPSKDHVFETIGHVASYSSHAAALQQKPSNTQPVVSTTQASDLLAVSETHEKTARNRWRPRFHIMPPTGWLNDPCAPGYDPVHDVYHVGFQWNPKQPEWGNISWGSAISKDLLLWETRKAPSIKPSPGHDGEAGVFTGCWSPVTAVPGCSSAFYTSARILPIHHTLPYNWGSEAICMATSADAGRTWQRGHESTVLEGPPRHLEVTGWRDPFVSAWHSLSRLLEKDPDSTIFGIVSGGVRGSGPALFLYSIASNDLKAWNFLSTITLTPLLGNARLSRWHPDYGTNWEVVNFLSLPDPDDPSRMHEILIIGVEGREQAPGATSGRYRHTEFRRDHCQMWASGDLVKGLTGIQVQFNSGGALDYGALYAVNSFRDPKTNHQVAFGWIVEEDLTQEQRQLQGWAGLLSIPRIVQLQRIRRVVHALKTDLASVKTFSMLREVVDEPQTLEQSHAEHPDTYTMTTLCALPDPRLKSLRDCQVYPMPASISRLPGALGSLQFPVGRSCWEVDMSFDIGCNAESVGFVISHSKDSDLRTVVAFNPEMELLRISRASSTNIQDICVADEEAPHTLFSTLAAPITARSEPTIAQEPLRLHAFFDVSCLELFANDRTAITTRVYPETMTCWSIDPFVTTKEEQPWSGKLLECTAWEMRTGQV